MERVRQKWNWSGSGPSFIKTSTYSSVNGDFKVPNIDQNVGILINDGLEPSCPKSKAPPIP